MTIVRCYDPDLVDEATKEFQYDFDPFEWIEDRRNIALVNDEGDLNLLQYQRDGSYFGHFFYQSRGRDALKTAREMLDYIFNMGEVEVIVGLTPVEKLGAKWLTRKIGFRSYGEIETVPGTCELFILTKSEYEKDKA